MIWVLMLNDGILFVVEGSEGYAKKRLKETETDYRERQPWIDPERLFFHMRESHLEKEKS